MKDEEWEMKDGTKIMVEDMDERHAKNCLRLLMRRINEHNMRNKSIRLLKDLNKYKMEEFLMEEGDR